MALLTLDDLKVELGLEDASEDRRAQSILTGVLSALDEGTNRTWEKGARTEYYNARAGQDRIFLKNRPVDSALSFALYDDPDWQWPASTLIPAADYRVDYEKGIVYYGAWFSEGKQSVKVIYTAGYSSTTLPSKVRAIIVRQAAVWFKQAKHGRWDLASEGRPAGAGTTSYIQMSGGFMPEFAALMDEEGS